MLVPLRIINLNLDLEEARIFKRVNREQHNSCERNQILTEILNLLEEGKLLCCSRKYGWKGLQVKPDIRLVVPSTIPFEGQATNSLIQAGDTKWRVKAKTDSCRFSTAFASSPFRKKLKEDGTSTEDPATRGYAGESWRNVRGGSCLWSCVRLGVKGKLFLCMQLARVRAMNCQSKLLNGGFLVTLTVQIDWNFLFLSGKNLEVRSVKVCRKNRFCQINLFTNTVLQCTQLTTSVVYSYETTIYYYYNHQHHHYHLLLLILFPFMLICSCYCRYYLHCLSAQIATDNFTASGQHVTDFTKSNESGDDLDAILKVLVVLAGTGSSKQDGNISKMATDPTQVWYRSCRSSWSLEPAGQGKLKCQLACPFTGDRKNPDSSGTRGITAALVCRVLSVLCCLYINFACLLVSAAYSPHPSRGAATQYR